MTNYKVAVEYVRRRHPAATPEQLAEWAAEVLAEWAEDAARERHEWGLEDSPCLESCDQWGTGEGAYHGLLREPQARYTVTGYTKTGIYSTELEAPTAAQAIARGERDILAMRPLGPVLRWTARDEAGEVILSTRAKVLREPDAPYTFHSDPGHGWLAVPVDELHSLNVSTLISRYSYLSRDGRTAYLEEDCDLATFARAKLATMPPEQAAKGLEGLIRDQHHAGECFIRELPRYLPKEA